MSSGSRPHHSRPQGQVTDCVGSSSLSVVLSCLVFSPHQEFPGTNDRNSSAPTFEHGTMHVMKKLAGHISYMSCTLNHRPYGHVRNTASPSATRGMLGSAADQTCVPVSRARDHTEQKDAVSHSKKQKSFRWMQVSEWTGYPLLFCKIGRLVCWSLQ